MPSVFPLKTEETILDLLAEDDKGYLAMKTCSLVRQAFLAKCRKHIFGSIFLNDPYMEPRPTIHTPHEFERLLRETPEIANHIRKLDYTIEIADLTNPSIQDSLRRITRLESLRVRPGHLLPRLDWSNNSIRPALLHLLHLPTLTRFRVTHVNNFVVSDLIPCVNLKYLDIGFFTTGAAENTFPAALPERSIQPNEFISEIGTPTAIMKLCTSRRPDGQPIIDFGSLTKITVDVKEPNESEAALELFRRCHILTNAHITFWDSQNVKPSLADMLRPSMKTLKHIVLGIHINDDDEVPLSGIPSELEEMSTKNIIETVTIEILVQTDVDCHLGDNWGRIDKLLTTSGWSSLKRVSVAIDIASYCRSDDELEVALRKLPETQFPRLSSSNSVSFDFNVHSVLV